ncbi:MAG: hypothetical protein CM15mP49_26040 [Actinomycetota bacterium]|nr:MAG: hypothetical protein CM15mP49_26040 [Actinomycetota bacterium]
MQHGTKYGLLIGIAFAHLHPDINTSKGQNSLISLNEAYATLVAVTDNGKKAIPVEESPAARAGCEKCCAFL